MHYRRTAFILPLAPSVRAALDTLCAAVEQALPIPSRFLPSLPRDIAQLSRLLTSERTLRKGGYLGEPRLLSAYCRYFLPWNVWRLCKLFSSFSAGDIIREDRGNLVIADWGAGPATLACAIWAAFPELRTMPLVIYACDRNKQALAAGQHIFSAFAGKHTSWRIISRNARIDKDAPVPPAVLTTLIYTLNELFAWIPQADTDELRVQAEKIAARLIQQTAHSGALLIVEPGAPRPAQTLVFLKEAFERAGYAVQSPCTSSVLCPARGGRKGEKWCHFTFDTADAPSSLKAISAEAGLPKANATLSFLLVRHAPPVKSAAHQVRVLSASFALPLGGTGRYGCGEWGLVLLRCGTGADKLQPGDILTFETAAPSQRDAKSGALIIDIAD